MRYDTCDLIQILPGEGWYAVFWSTERQMPFCEPIDFVGLAEVSDGDREYNKLVGVQFAGGYEIVVDENPSFAGLVRSGRPYTDLGLNGSLLPEYQRQWKAWRRKRKRELLAPKN